MNRHRYCIIKTLNIISGLLFGVLAACYYFNLLSYEIILAGYGVVFVTCWQTRKYEKKWGLRNRWHP